MKTRKIIRIVFVGIGMIGLYSFVRSGFESYPDLFMGGMFIFISATNFCTQCPLLSAVTGLLKRSRHNRISTKKLS